MKIELFIFDTGMILFFIYSGMMKAAAPEGTPPRRIGD
jgi:hypothetical protein